MKSFFADLYRQKFYYVKCIIESVGGGELIIYADVLVALNILLTYILIVASRVLCKIPTNKWAVVTASLMGGVSSLIIFYENGGTAFSCFYKIITGAIIVCIGFLPRSLKTFLKEFLAFGGVSLLFGGAMYALEITLHPKSIMFYNGTVYFEMSIAYLVGCVLVIYGIFLLADYLITKHNHKGGKCQLEITYNNTTVNLIAFLDTGNTLTDSMSGRPVIIAELSAVSPLFTREEIMFFKKGNFENVPESLNKSFRLIPCMAVTGESLLKAFLPTAVKIKEKEKIYETSFCTIALTEKSLSQGEYKALLNTRTFENVKEEKNDEKIHT